MLCSYIYIGQYLYVNILLFLYLCFHICFYCSTSLFYWSGSVTSASLVFSCAKLWRPCQMPSTRRDLLIWLKLSWKPSANNTYLGIPEKFLPNSLAFWLLWAAILSARKKATGGEGHAEVWLKKNIGSNETNNCKRLEGSGNPKYNF